MVYRQKCKAGFEVQVHRTDRDKYTMSFFLNSVEDFISDPFFYLTANEVWDLVDGLEKLAEPDLRP